MGNKLTKEQIMALEKASEALFELASLALIGEKNFQETRLVRYQ